MNLFNGALCSEWLWAVWKLVRSYADDFVVILAAVAVNGRSSVWSAVPLSQIMNSRNAIARVQCVDCPFRHSLKRSGVNRACEVAKCKSTNRIHDTECKTFLPRTYSHPPDKQFSHPQSPPITFPPTVKAKIWKLALTRTPDLNRSTVINFIQFKTLSACSHTVIPHACQLAA